MAARASRIRTAIAGFALATLLASCATGTDVDEGSVGASGTPTAPPTASPEPTPEPTTFTTQNGTASFLLPDGWTVEDTSETDLVTNHGGPAWQNWLTLLDADGTPRAHYGDGYADDVGAVAQTGTVQSIAMTSGLHAAAWWSTSGEGDDWHVDAAVVADVTSPNRTVVPEGFDRLHSFSADLAAVPECASVTDEASAVACLEAPGTTEALELLATLELEPLPWDAMPAGVDPVATVPWTRFDSADGAIAFEHPAAWTVEGTSDGHGFWLTTPDGYETLHFSLLTSEWGGSDLAAMACTDPTAMQTMTVIESEAVTPLAADLADDVGDLEIVTADYGYGGFVGVAILRAQDAAIGCLSQTVPIGDGAIWAATAWGTDAPMQIYAKYPGGEGFVGSFDQLAMVQVLRTLEIRHLSA